jgi:metal-dependent hydrolase (beta-lactamase superfamily II)
MMELQFTGIGSAFNTELGNTSAFIREKNSMFLIDSGGTVFHKLKTLRLFEALENLYIIITHTHPDHVGSLGEVIFYAHYIQKIKPFIFFPDKNLLNNIFFGIGVGNEMYTLQCTENAVISDENFGNIEIEFTKVSHTKTMPAYGFFLKLQGMSLYYGGDADDVNEAALQRLKSGEIDRLYQDTCGLEYEGNSHTSLRRLKERVSQEYRNKVYCMHLDEHINKTDIIDSGFKVAEIYK